MIIAYLRVGKKKQYLDIQKEEIEHFVAEKGWMVDKWVTDVNASNDSKNKNLDLLLDRLQQGDILVVTDISRLSRTLTDVMAIISRCLDKEVNLFSINDRYVLDGSVNREVMSRAFGLVTEIEHNLMSTRTKEALAHKKTIGVRLGRPKGSDAKQSFLEANKEEVIRMLERGESVVAICKHFNVSRNTYYQFKRNYGI